MLQPRPGRYLLPTPRGRTGRPPRSRHPAGEERRLGRVLDQAIAPLPKLVAARVLPELRRLVRAAPAEVNPHDHADQDEDPIGDLFAGVRIEYERTVPEAELSRAVLAIDREVAARGKAELAGQVRAVLGVDPFVGEPWLAPVLADSTRAAVALVKTVPDRYLSTLEQRVRRGVLSGLSSESLADQIRADFTADGGKDLAQAYSRVGLIARDQTAKLNGTLARVRQQDLGVTRYRWRTSLDERVRPEHARREGKIFDWSSPPIDGAPGQPPLCRCTAEPVLDDLIGE